MRALRVILFGLAAFAASLPAQQPKVSRDEAAIRAVLQHWLDALKAGDVAELKRILPEDYSITVSEGRLLNRDQDLEPITSARFKFASADADSVNVRFVGKDVAIVTGIGRFSVMAADRTINVRERFTDVYEKRKGKWMPVSSHSTSLRP